MFTEALPYHSTVMNKGERFEIYMQAFRVIDKENFLEQAKLLYLAMPNKSEAGWDTVGAMFAAFLEGGSSYYVGRSIKGGFWRYWGTKKAAVEKEGTSGYAKQTVVGIMQALVDKKVVEHKAVVLWRAKEGEDVPAIDQIRLEMFFGFANNGTCTS